MSSSGRKSILVVDDEDLVRESLVRILRLEGYDALSAENAERARGLLATQSVDLVTLDVGMPGEGGISLLRHISEAYPHLPVIILTGRFEATIEFEAYSGGAVQFLLKPVKSAELVASIRDCLAVSVREGDEPGRILDQILEGLES
jgi:DNA-binding NtrC family response regulator